MLKVDATLWVGNSQDGACKGDFECVLNVAHDLPGVLCWDDEVEYAQVGLQDGPGNTLESYCAAVLALSALLRKGRVLMYDHNGARALAVCLMHHNVVCTKPPGSRTWDECLDVFRERVEVDYLPSPGVAHREAFAKMPWEFLAEVVNG